MNLEQQALSIIESYCGQSFGVRTANERIPLKNNIGRLGNEPALGIDSIRVRSENWAFSSVFGASDWVTLDPDDVLLKDNYIAVTGGVLDAHYTEADVTYRYGYAELPANIREAVRILERQLSDLNGKSTYSLSSALTPEVVELLAPYNTYRR